MMKTDVNIEEPVAPASTTKADIDNEIKRLADEKTEQPFIKDEEFNPFTADEIINVRKPEDQFNEFGFQGQSSTPSFLNTGKKGKDNAELRQIDELLASVPQAQGYYLKLEKEVGPNEWQFKIRINDYAYWADLEWETVKLVRAYTQKDPLSYGSGKYRIVVWRDQGMRGDKRPPYIFNIDAQESMLPKNAIPQQVHAETVEDKLEGMAKLVATMQNFMPKPVDPNTQVQQMAEAFQKGQELAKTKESGTESSLATMMTAMMQMQQQASKDNMAMMMMMMQSMNKQPVEDEFTKMLKMKMITEMGNAGKVDPSMRPIAMIKELREAGMIPKKDEGGLGEQLKTIMALKDVAGAMFGEGGSSAPTGVLDKLFSSVGEKLPDIIGAVTGTINNVVALNKAKLDRAQRVAKLTRNPVANPVKESGTIPPANIKPVTDSSVAQPIQTVEDGEGLEDTVIIDDKPLRTQEEKMGFLAMMFAQQLNNWVLNDVTTEEVFDKITAATLKITENKPMIQNALKDGTMQPADLAGMIVSDLDKTNYNTPEKLQQLVKYCQSYANYIIGDAVFIVECNKCGQQYNFESQAEFDDLSRSEQFCEGEENAPCGGELLPVSNNKPVNYEGTAEEANTATSEPETVA